MAKTIADLNLTIEVNEKMIAEHINKRCFANTAWMKNYHTESTDFALGRIREAERQREFLYSQIVLTEN